MKIAVIGAGAVGSYYGARLALSGNDVGFVVRNAASLERLRAGIRIRSVLGNVTVTPVKVVTDVRELDLPDLIIIAVKLWDTADVVAAIAPVAKSGSSVISLQNGVDKEEVIAAGLGRPSLLGAVTYIIVNRIEDGTIVHSGTFQRIIVGELDGSGSDRVQTIVRTLSASGIDASSSTVIRRETWEKFIFLASISGMTAATRKTIGEIRSDSATRTMLNDAMLEAAVLARTEGVAIADDFVEGRMRFIDTLPADGRSSMANDVLRGSRLELEWLSGAVVRRAERHRLPAPVHTKLYHELLPLASGR